MAEQAAAESGGEAASAKPAGRKGPVWLVPAVALVAALVGAVVGALIIAPRFQPAAPAVTAGLDPAPAEPAPEGPEKGPIFRVDNLIVNPAGSQGSRFLMISLAVETPDAKVDAVLRRQEARIRDLAISLLERLTMEALSTPGIRDSLKRQLSDTISAVAGTSTKLRVFLPQFVVQ